MKTITTALQILLCVCIVALSVTLAQNVHASQFPPQARQALFRAQKAIADKSYNDADAVLTKYLQTTSEQPPVEVYMMLGSARNDLKNIKGALDSFLAGIRKYPENEQLYQNTAVLLYEKKDYVKAAEMFEKAYSYSKKPKLQTLYNAAATYYEGNNFQQAARVISTMLAKANKPRKEWIQLAIHSYLQAGQQTKALSYLNDLLKQFPQEAAYWKLLAKVHMDRSKFVQAAAALETSYSFKAPTKQDLIQLSQLYTFVNAPLKAARILEKTDSPNRTTDQAIKIAKLYTKGGMPEKGLHTITTALARSQNKRETIELAMYKATLLYSLRRFSEAYDEFSECISKSSMENDARFYRALCAWEMKKWSVCKKDFNTLKLSKQYKSRALNALAALEDLEESNQEATGG